MQVVDAPLSAKAIDGVDEADDESAERAPLRDASASRLQVLAAAVAVGALATAVGAVVLSQTVGTAVFYWSDAANAVTYSVIGAIIACNRPRHPIGWLILLIAVSGAAGACLPELGRLALAADFDRVAVVIGWLAAWVWWPMVGSLPLLGLLFPDGRLPSRRWRLTLFAFVGVLVVPIVALMSVAFVDPFAALVDPSDLAGTVIMKVNVPALLAVLACMLLAVLSIALRWRRATAVVRRQVMWLVWGLAVWATWQIGTWLVPEAIWADRLAFGDVGYIVADALIPIAIAVAVLRYRLYAIEVIVQKSLVWALLTIAVVVGYVSIVTVLGNTVIRGDSRLGSLVAAAVIAVVFAPGQRQLQGLVDRAIYGRRGDPTAVLARLTSGIQQASDPNAVLPALVRGLAEELKLPYVAVEAEQGLRESFGAARGRVLCLPLTHFGAPVGMLFVSGRGPSDPLSPADRRVLKNVLPVASTAVYALILNADLSRSRDGIVRAREEERRRLRHDLHDGTKPALAGLSMGLEAAARSAARDPSALPDRLRQLRDLAHSAAVEVTRMVDGLGPASLDERGLPNALREQARWLSQQGDVRITVETSGEIPVLPAAVEIAAYRIAVEAMTNVIKHSRATICTVSIQVAETLELLIVDNGVGLSDATKQGVGFASMRERAAELGGSLSAGSTADGGAAVAASLPLKAA